MMVYHHNHDDTSITSIQDMKLSASIALGDIKPKEEEASAEPVATETLSADVTPVDTPILETVTPALPYGLTLAQINVRSGPASSFPSYGLIEKKQTVTILGQTLNGLWFQIQYPAAPNGVAWVSSVYVQVMKSIKGLPYFDNMGNPLP
jgi:hypothetical protein